MVLRRIDAAGEQPSQPAQSSGTSAMTSGGPLHAGGVQHDQQDRPVSPVGSLYAMSDDEEGEYNTITHAGSGKGVKLLYSKSKVCLSVLDFATLPSFEYYAALYTYSILADFYGYHRFTYIPHPLPKTIYPASSLCFSKNHLRVLVLPPLMAPTQSP